MIRWATSAALVALSLTALPGAASAPDTSLRPFARPVSGAGQDAAAPAIAPARLAPRMRPDSLQGRAAAGRPEAFAFAAPDSSPIPWVRPDDVAQQALFHRRKKRKGSVCGDIDIQGEPVGRVTGKMKGCGVKDAVRVRSVSGVMLSQPSVMDCTTARALNRWVDKGVRLAFRPEGKVVELKVAAHYSCRTRNNKRGARISEHGRGKAIDISAFVLRNGEVITVAKGWTARQSTRKMLRRAWKTACGPFGTVLGPNADRYHWNHFHLDTASYRGGPYCK